MSRVLARSMFKKNAPKRSSKGVGITSMLEDDVPGYAEGGEVENDKSKRDEEARALLDLSKQEFQQFSPLERPQMTRLPATMPAMPQVNPQMAQAAQIQQLAQMGMLPRFADGGPVEAPTSWSEARRGIGNLIGIRGRQPLFARGTGEEVYASPVGSMTGSPASDNPEYALPKDNWFARLYRQPSNAPSSAIPTGDIGIGFNVNDLPIPEGGGRSLSPLSDLAKVPGALLGRPQFSEPSPPNEAEQAAMEADRESRRAAGFRKIAPKEAPPKEKPQEKTAPSGPPKTSDLTDIKAERAAKEAAARQENAWLALMQAGLAIAGGQSPNALTNIGQGGQQGLASFMALEQQRRKDEDAAMRRGIMERELQLQEQMAPYKQRQAAASAAYWEGRPAVEQAKLAAQQQVAHQRAIDAAQKAWENRTKSGPFSLEYLNMNKVQKKAAEELYLKEEYNRRYREELSAFRAGVYGGGQQGSELTPGE